MSEQTPHKTIQKRVMRGHIGQYLQKNRGRPQYRPAPVAGGAVRNVLRPLSKKYGSGLPVLKDRWLDIVGPRWNNVCKPVSIRGSKDGRILTIVAKGPAATLLQADSENILSRVNRMLGPRYVKRIILKQGLASAYEPKIQSTQFENLHRERLHKPLERRGIKVQSGSLTDALNRMERALDRRAKEQT